ncbi:protein phosphatase 1 regulatory subunit 35 [Vombatus ursinus]|uniref:Protein phosphatase 1 regulatory subunit 35 C-terminal domain-containing protein n=1 Tax=Vombatus ursinus TaxID=29139 RepID=A0A4X2JML4_VOMUR|nr:protein phosphatase 1 regulatory subunit 35 [Vombatus ursinus]
MMLSRGKGRFGGPSREGVTVGAPEVEPEPFASKPEPEPGLDLSLSPGPRSPEPPCSILRLGGARSGGRRGQQRARQVRFHLASPCQSPASSVSPPRGRIPTDEPLEKCEALPHLVAPGLQSTLALGQQLESLREVTALGQFDALKAAEEQLKSSFLSRCEMEENVSEGLNMPRSQRLYRDLVSLQVPKEQVLNAALMERLALLPSQPQVPIHKIKEVPAAGPELSILCDPQSLAHESPHLMLEGFPLLKLKPQTRPAEDTFLMHQTLRRWDT